MLLACAGIYGVLSFVTARRTQELGIRAALGASRSSLMRMVVGSGTTPVLIGIAIGLAGAMALARFIESLLFDTKPLDAHHADRRQRDVPVGRARRLHGAGVARVAHRSRDGAALGMKV